VGLIYLDSCLVIYLVENHPRWGELVTGAIARAEEARFGISPLVKCECLVGTMRRGDLVLERAYSQSFDQFALLPIPDPVFVQAARLRAHFSLRTPDALHLACAQYHGCEALWTNDDRLARGSNGLAYNILR
jgi:predicted nucleic acid-binding protein